MSSPIIYKDPSYPSKNSGVGVAYRPSQAADASEELHKTMMLELVNSLQSALAATVGSKDDEESNDNEILNKFLSTKEGAKFADLLKRIQDESLFKGKIGDLTNCSQKEKIRIGFEYLQQVLNDVIKETTEQSLTCQKEDPSDSVASDSFMKMAKVLSSLAASIGSITTLLAKSSDIQAEQSNAIAQKLIQDACDALLDINKQIEEIEKAKKKKHDYGIFGKIFGAIAVVVVVVGCALSCQPITSKTINQAYAFGNTNFIEDLVKGVVGFINLEMKYNPLVQQEIHLTTDISGQDLSETDKKILAEVIIMIMCGALAAVLSGGNPVVVMAVVTMVASSTSFFGDVAEDVIEKKGIDPNSPEAAKIRMATMIGGEALCMAVLLGSCFFGVGAVALPEMLTSFLEQVPTWVIPWTMRLMTAASLVEGIGGMNNAAVDMGVAKDQENLEKAVASMKFCDNLSKSIIEQSQQTTDAYTEESVSLGSSLEELIRGWEDALKSNTALLA